MHFPSAFLPDFTQFIIIIIIITDGYVAHTNFLLHM
jgi:hypothetical protein